MCALTVLRWWHDLLRRARERRDFYFAGDRPLRLLLPVSTKHWQRIWFHWGERPLPIVLSPFLQLALSHTESRQFNGFHTALCISYMYMKCICHMEKKHSNLEKLQYLHKLCAIWDSVCLSVMESLYPEKKQKTDIAELTGLERSSTVSLYITSMRISRPHQKNQNDDDDDDDSPS